MQIKKMYRLLGIIILCMIGLFSTTIQAAEFKVLVVMSYEQMNPWCVEIKDGIDSALGNRCEVTYFYMDTKVNLEGGVQKAKEAYSLFKDLQPDGVITVDDNAQSMFVLQYLNDKAKTPVMFCGVNAEPEKYGYPASNVSGILERAHVNESIALAKQLVPSIKTIATRPQFLYQFLYADSLAAGCVRCGEQWYYRLRVSVKSGPREPP